MADLIEQFRHVKSRPDMYLCPVKYKSAVALVIGYDLATDDLLLQGFHEWLMVKLEYRSSFFWSRLIPMIAFPDTPDLFEEWSEDTPSLEDEKITITTLFYELEEFYLVKKDQSRGARWVYAQYDELCKRLDARHVAGLSPEEIEKGTHTAFVKDGRVYDAFSDPNGMTIEEYKKAWGGTFDINFDVK